MSTPEDFASATQALVAALSSSVSDPGDALRLLSDLSAFVPVDPTAPAIGAVASEMKGATADLFRRAAVVAMARAAAAYQPSSYDDAAQVRTIVCAALDAEITTAGNQGEDASFVALKALRVAVIQDLTERGATLAHISTIKTAASVPALVLANRLYQDPSRAEDLIARGNPRHPAFMPTAIKALSS